MFLGLGVVATSQNSDIPMFGNWSSQNSILVAQPTGCTVLPNGEDCCPRTFNVNWQTHLKMGQWVCIYSWQAVSAGCPAASIFLHFSSSVQLSVQWRIFIELIIDNYIWYSWRRGNQKSRRCCSDWYLHGRGRNPQIGGNDATLPADLESHGS